MPKYRAQIIWDFDFDDKGITESEYEWRFDEDDEITPRTPAEMEEYARDELVEALWSAAKYNDFYQMVDVIKIEE